MQHATKPSSFVKAGGSASVPALSWFDTNRALILRVSLAAVAAILILVSAVTYISSRSAKAASAFSDAMDVYDTPLRQPNQPVDPNTQTFATAADRAKAANPLFAKIASQYGLFEAGKNARYFAGLTALDMGQTAQAEADLKQVAGSGSALGALAKLALASLYRQTNRQPQAIELYQELIAKPALTVPVSTARLELAETYEATRPDEARRLYAQIKDEDKTSAAAQIATQKLDGKK
jgi:predicted negative regulator of RcsB-dependent stress response